MAEVCPECGGPVPDGGSCRDNFNALLLLEWQIPGGPGALPHFYAVSIYGLQHPDSMNYTADALAGLREALGDVLDGRVTVPELRRRIRRNVNGQARVTRRAGEKMVAWQRGNWPMTVADVCPGGVDGYADRVVRWARSVREALAVDQS